MTEWWGDDSERKGRKLLVVRPPIHCETYTANTTQLLKNSLADFCFQLLDPLLSQVTSEWLVILSQPPVNCSVEGYSCEV